MKPTIGRKVWFWPNGSNIGVPGAAQPASFSPEQALDATVVCVHGERMVNLLVVDHGGTAWPIRSVTLRQDGDAVPTGMYCEWMPYQVAQAKKEEPVKAVTDTAIETEIVAKGLTAMRITPGHIDELCGPVENAKFHVFPGTTLTVCCIELPNGFTVVGESACASPENFDADIGKKIAFANAREKVWALEGYALRGALWACAQTV